MLSAHHITKTYGIHTVLQDITFSINPGDRLGLIGPNGCGKTTLLRILTGQEKPEFRQRGAHTPPGLRIGYLPQGFELDPALTIAEACAPAPARTFGIGTSSNSPPPWPPTRPINISRLPTMKPCQIIGTCRPCNLSTCCAPLGLADIPPEKHDRRTLRRSENPSHAGAAAALENPTCCCWMNPPTTSILACSNGWKAGWRASPARP